MTALSFRLVDSLEKVLPDREPPIWNNGSLRGFQGETVSVQLAYACQNDDSGGSDRRFLLDVEHDERVDVTVRKVELVPCAYPCHGTWDDGYLDTRPGLYPDLLTPLKTGAPVKAIAAQWRALWIDIHAQPGRHEVALRLTSLRGDVLQAFVLPVEVMRSPLPPQRLIHTEWFHADCLADYYRVPVFSEAHWRIIDNFMASAARHGVNMLLTPVFTPPLDTAIGGERTTVQLVDVKKSGNSYSFDFEKLGRWISLCEKNGIRYLEIAHLFSQWGATFAPKIMVSVDGGPQEKLFGWHTPAVGGEYTAFLRGFLPALKAYLAEAGWLDRTWFHISDEPNDSVMETYRQAKASVIDLLAGCRVIDALSSYEVYRKGVVEKPVVSVDQIEPFIRDGVPGLWAYYCTAQALEVPNRFIAMTSARTRILGVLLYYFELEGFLHWGFNFYNTQGSAEHIDPFRVTDAGEAFPSGDPFLVYPAPDGTAYDSIRGMVLRQALSDLRALQLLEEKIGRRQVKAMLTELAGGALSFRSHPETAAFFETLRAAIYAALDGKTFA